MGSHGRVINFELNYPNGIVKHVTIHEHMDLVELFSDRYGLSEWHHRYVLDGQYVNRPDTPRTLGMEDGDVIDVIHRPFCHEPTCPCGYMWYILTPGYARDQG